jgi:hypothetical protein
VPKKKEARSRAGERDCCVIACKPAKTAAARATAVQAAVGGPPHPPSLPYTTSHNFEDIVPRLPHHTQACPTPHHTPSLRSPAAACPPLSHTAALCGTQCPPAAGCRCRCPRRHLLTQRRRRRCCCCWRGAGRRLPCSKAGQPDQLQMARGGTEGSSEAGCPRLVPCPHRNNPISSTRGSQAATQRQAGSAGS